MTLTQQTGARSARGARRRDEILDAAVTTFVDPGFRAASLRDIAAAAGISHPGLLRHFHSKDDLLLAVVSRFEEDNRRWALTQAADGAVDWGALARRNHERTGYRELFSALVGEATSPRHPAHERMRTRYRELRRQTTHSLSRLADAGELAPDRDPADEALRLIAAWDGMQLLELYLPGTIDLEAALDRYRELLRHPLHHRSDGTPPARPDTPWTGRRAMGGDDPDADGYGTGRRRRENIVAAATALFAASGYATTSMQEVADRVGVSKSALFHHYPTKEDLLRAVLTARDRTLGHTAAAPHPSTATALLRQPPLEAAHSLANAPGLIEVYAVLSCEAVPAGHPAHDYFAHRFAELHEVMTELFTAAAAAGTLSAHRDPAHEAAWLIALWDGLQFQWAYDRDEIDVAAQLRAHLADVLPS